MKHAIPNTLQTIAIEGGQAFFVRRPTTRLLLHPQSTDHFNALHFVIMMKNLLSVIFLFWLSAQTSVGKYTEIAGLPVPPSHAVATVVYSHSIDNNRG